LERIALSGLNAAQYAEAQRRSVIKFRRLRRRFELNPLAQNWHDLYHPAALDSSQAETNLRQQLRPTAVKRTAVEAPTAPLPDLSSKKRRQYTTARKLAIVAETTEAGVTASMVARRHGVTPSMIVRWRNQFGMTPMEHPLLITARVVATPARGRSKPTLPLVLQNLLPAPPGVIAVELANGRRVFAPAGSDRSVLLSLLSVLRLASLRHFLVFSVASWIRTSYPGKRQFGGVSFTRSSGMSWRACAKPSDRIQTPNCSLAASSSAGVLQPANVEAVNPSGVGFLRSFICI
jgi:transposase-like protein